MFKSFTEKTANLNYSRTDHTKLDEKIRQKVCFNKNAKVLNTEELDKISSDFNPEYYDIFKPSETKELEWDIRVRSFGNEIYVNNILAVQAHKANIPPLNPVTRDKYRKDLEDSFSVACSSISDVVSSSSPSMILHQTCAILFSKMFNSLFVFEEHVNEFRADLREIDTNERTKNIIEVTSSEFNLKASKMIKRGIDSFILVDKYALVLEINTSIRNMKRLSLINDRKDTGSIMELVKSQSLGKELYSAETLDFLMKPRYNFHTDKEREDCQRKGETIEEDIEILGRIARGYICATVIGESSQSKEVNMSESFSTSKEIILDAMSDCCKPYTSVTISNIPTYSDKMDTRDKRLYDQIGFVTIENKFHIGMLSDHRSVEYKDLVDLYSACRIDFTLNRKGFEKYKINVMKTLQRRSGIRYNDGFFVKDREKNLLKFLNGTEVVTAWKVPFYEKFFGPGNYIEVDPYHKEILEKYLGPRSHLEKLLSNSRDYHDLRMRERIARALYISRKPDKKIKVYHWLYECIYAECYIRGLLFEKDKGVAIVSFFDQNTLVKTEKWHLADVENFNAAPDVLVSTCIGLVLDLNKGRPVQGENETKTEIKNRTLAYMNYVENTTSKIYELYSALLTENSWSVGSFLKPLRYWISGCCMSSESLVKTANKVAKEVKNSNKCRHSLKLIRDLISQSRYTKDRTPLFCLPFDLIGYECFLVNLTPAKTYGNKRHLRGCMEDLIKEIQLSATHIADIKDIIEDFEEIISLKKTKEDTDDELGEYKFETVLTTRVQDHMRMISSLSDKTSGRFTLSPISICMLTRSIDKLLPNLASQTSCPHISELMTAKASWNSDESSSMMAIETISSLCKEMKTHNLSEIAMNLISDGRPKDLYMRMFDKDQTAANREISILSSQFRVLQSIAERFARGLGRQTDRDMLDNPNKINKLVSHFSTALKSETRLFLTMDQTRWGPNFNTSLFGWLHAYLLRFTTESFLPMIICLMSEFKVFGSPPELNDILLKSDTMYSGLGYMGRFHMAQGIFHYNSSLYHSLVNETLLEIIRESYYVSSDSLDPRSRSTELIFQHLVTSDDACMFIHTRGSPVKTEYGYYFIKRRLESALGSYKFFSILTSEYKNIFSRDMIEFNSNYLSKDGLGSNDLKFLKSLICNQTTGSFWEDYRKAFDSHGDALNSNCSEDNSSLIRDVNLGRVSKRWRLKLERLDINMLDPEYNCMFFPKFSKPLDPELSFGDPSVLKFKTRDRIRAHICSDSNFSSLIINNKINRIEGSVGKSNYKALFVPSMEKWYDHLKNMNVNCLEPEFYIPATRIFRSCIVNRNNVYELYNKQNDRPYLEYTKLSECKPMSFFVRKYSVSEDSTDKMMQVLVSNYNKVSHMNQESSPEEIILHLLRRHCVLDIPIEKRTKLSLLDYYVELIDNQDRTLSRNVSSLRYNSEMRALFFDTHIYSQFKNLEDIIPPKALSLIVNPSLRYWTRDAPLKRGFGVSYYSVKINGKNSFDIQSIEDSRAVTTSTEENKTITIEVPNIEEKVRTSFLRTLEYERLHLLEERDKRKGKSKKDEPLYVVMTVDPNMDLSRFLIESDEEDFDPDEIDFEDLQEQMDYSEDDLENKPYSYSENVSENVVSIRIPEEKRHLGFVTMLWFKEMVMNNMLMEQLVLNNMIVVERENMSDYEEKTIASSNYTNKPRESGRIITNDKLFGNKFIDYRNKITRNLENKIRSERASEESWRQYVLGIFDLGRPPDKLEGELTIDIMFSTDRDIIISAGPHGHVIEDPSKFIEIMNENKLVRERGDVFGFFEEEMFIRKDLAADKRGYETESSDDEVFE